MKKNDITGNKYITNSGENFEVIKHINSRNNTIKFDDETILTNISTIEIKKGRIKNPNQKSQSGIGYIGIGKHICSINYKTTIAYDTWRGMISRCYNPKIWVRHPLYQNCSVDSDWHNFQNFADWFELNYIQNFHLDKDLLVKGNKIYSKDTCCFVPNELNNILGTKPSLNKELPIGVRKHGNKFRASINLKNKTIHLNSFLTPLEAFNCYKITKENHIKEIANIYKELININVYNALISYEIEPFSSS